MRSIRGHYVQTIAESVDLAKSSGGAAGMKPLRQKLIRVGDFVPVVYNTRFFKQAGQGSVGVRFQCFGTAADVPAADEHLRDGTTARSRWKGFANLATAVVLLVLHGVQVHGTVWNTRPGKQFSTRTKRKGQTEFAGCCTHSRGGAAKAFKVAGPFLWDSDRRALGLGGALEGMCCRWLSSALYRRVANDLALVV